MIISIAQIALLVRDHEEATEFVHFTEKPRDESYGKVAVFEDLYGNRIDLIQPTAH